MEQPGSEGDGGREGGREEGTKTGKGAQAGGGSMIQKSLPGAMVNFSAALLVWLFGVLVFLPTAARIEAVRLPLVISIIIIIPFTLFFYRGLKGLGDAASVVSRIFTNEWMARGRARSPERVRAVFSGALYIIALTVGYLLYSQLLTPIHPAINGIAIILLVLVAVWIAVSTERAISPQSK